MAKASAFQELLDRVVDAVERMQRDAPALGALANEWRRGYTPQGAGVGGNSELTAPERIATSPGQPDRDIAIWVRDVEAWAKGGIDLEKRRAHLLPVDAGVAKLLVERDGPCCRLHAEVGSHRPVYRKVEDLCRDCYDFKRREEAEPPLWIVERWARGQRVYDRHVRQWRDDLDRDAGAKPTGRRTARRLAG